MAKLWQRIEYDDKEGMKKTNEEAKNESNPGRSDPSILVDPCCMILSNLTLDPENAEIVWTEFVKVIKSRFRVSPFLSNFHHFKDIFQSFCCQKQKHSLFKKYLK